MNKKRFIAIIALAALVSGIVWFARFWSYTHPVSPVVRFDMPGFFGYIPAEWSTDISTDPRLKSEYMMAVQAKVWRDSRKEFVQSSLYITEESSRTTVAAEIEAIHNDPQTKAKPIQFTMQPGVVAYTWTEGAGYTDLAAEDRWYVFQMPNGRIFSAMNMVIPDFATQRRLDYQFRQVLASLRVKKR